MLSIKSLEYCDGLIGFYLTTNDDRKLAVQFAIEQDALRGGYDEYDFCMADAEDPACPSPDFTDAETDELYQLLRNNEIISQHIRDLDEDYEREKKEFHKLDTWEEKAEFAENSKHTMLGGRF